MRWPLALGLMALALLLLPAGQAAPPPEQPWRVTLTGGSLGAGPALGIDFDDTGANVVLATADVSGDGALPISAPTQDNDLVHLLWESGNATAQQDAANTAPGEGKEAVAVSGDGRFAIAAGNYSGGGTAGPNVFFFALPDLTPVWTKSYAESVSGVGISKDGSVAVVVTRNTTTGAGRIYRLDQSGFQAWQTGANACGSTSAPSGSANAVDVSDDGEWIVVGSTLATQEGPRGCVLLFPKGNFNPVAAYLVPVVPSSITAVDISPNGNAFGAGTDGGRFFLFRNVPPGPAPSRSAPLTDQLNALSRVVGVRVPGDASSIVVADATGVSRYVHTPGLLTLNWTAPVGGLRSLDATPDAEYIVAGGAQILGFHRSSNRTLWALDFPGAMVRVAEPSKADVRLAAASGAVVRGWRLHWAAEAVKSEPEPVQLQPGQARSFPLGLRNNGSGVDVFELSASSPDFAVSVQPPSLLLRPDEAGNATVTVTPRPGASAGLYVVNVAARGARSGLDVSAAVSTVLGAAPRLAIALGDRSYEDKAVFQSEEHVIPFVVQNGGNSRLDLAFDVSEQPNVGDRWNPELSRTSGVVEAGGTSTITLRLRVPAQSGNGTENLITVTARGEGVQASAQVRLVVNPIFTASIEVIPLSKVVTPGNSTTYQVVVANNGSLRESYQIIYCVQLPNLIPCLGNATRGLGGWSVAVDTSAFQLDRGQSKSFQLSVGAPRGAIPGVDKLALQVEVISATPFLNYPFHQFRDTRLVLTSVVEPTAPPKPPAFTPGFDAVLVALAAAGAAAVAARRR